VLEVFPWHSKCWVHSSVDEGNLNRKTNIENLCFNPLIGIRRAY
jgi:hypothetical protein